jgi:formylglycine-generating enzyme required for sulfatase activity
MFMSDRVHDWYETYPTGAVTDPQGPASSVSRVFRGGGWYSIAGNCRAAIRYWNAPDDRGYGVGFRPTRVLSEK